jgi:NTE family protein
MTVSRVIRYFDISLRGGGNIEGRWILDFFRESIADIEIANATPVFRAVATDLASGRETWLTSGSMIDVVRASIAIPGLLTPILIRGRWHVDGALVNPLPVSLCRALGADIIIAVSLNGNLMARPKPLVVTPAPPTPGELDVGDVTDTSWRRWLGYGRSTDAGATQQGPVADNRPGYLEVVSQTFFIVQDFVSRIRLAADPVDVLIAPDVAEIGWLEFHRAEEAIAAGEAAVAESLRAIRSLIDDKSQRQ